MKLKFRKSLTLNTLIPDVRANFLSANTRKDIKNAVLNEIGSGKSPVEGQKFKKYSPSYAKLKGRKSPVDMFVTGKMLESFQVRKSKSSFFLAFTNKVADYHNRLGRVIRRLLPTFPSERFNARIQKTITKALELAVSKSVKKQNRS